MSVVLGDDANAACFPTLDRASWNGLPNRCDKTINELDSVPHVAIGAGDNCDYIALSCDNDKYAIESDYRDLDRILDEAFAAGKCITVSVG